MVYWDSILFSENARFSSNFLVYTVFTSMVSVLTLYIIASSVAALYCYLFLHACSFICLLCLHLLVIAFVFQCAPPALSSRLKYYITTLFIMTVVFFRDILFWKNENCYHGNQLIEVLITCYNTAETVFVYDQFH